MPIASTSDKVLGAALAGCELAWGAAKGTAEYAAGTRAGRLASGGADLALSGVEKVVECLLPPAKDESGTCREGLADPPWGVRGPVLPGNSEVSRGGPVGFPEAPFLMLPLAPKGGKGWPMSPRRAEQSRGGARTAAPLISHLLYCLPAPAAGRRHPRRPPETKPSLVSRVGALADNLSRHTLQTTAQVLKRGHALAMWVPGVSPLVSVCPELHWPLPGLGLQVSGRGD